MTLREGKLSSLMAIYSSIGTDFRSSFAFLSLRLRNLAFVPKNNPQKVNVQTVMRRIVSDVVCMVRLLC